MSEKEDSGDRPDQGKPDYWRLGFEDGMKTGDIFIPPKNPFDPIFPQDEAQPFRDYIRGFTDGWIDSQRTKRREKFRGNGD